MDVDVKITCLSLISGCIYSTSPWEPTGDVPSPSKFTSGFSCVKTLSTKMSCLRGVFWSFFFNKKQLIYSCIVFYLLCEKLSLFCENMYKYLCEASPVRENCSIEALISRVVILHMFTGTTRRCCLASPSSGSPVVFILCLHDCKPLCKCCLFSHQSRIGPVSVGYVLVSSLCTSAGWLLNHDLERARFPTALSL